MTAIAFDTLKFSRALREKAKLSSDQADGFAEAIADAVQGDLATKSDLETLRLTMEALRLTMEARIETAKADTIKWVLSAIGFQTIVIVGAVVALARVS